MYVPFLSVTIVVSNSVVDDITLFSSASASNLTTSFSFLDEEDLVGGGEGSDVGVGDEVGLVELLVL